VKANVGNKEGEVGAPCPCKHKQKCRAAITDQCVERWINECRDPFVAREFKENID